jgi:TPR repeat protein
MYRYAWCLFDGNAVPRNILEAAKWFMTGADRGHMLCQFEYARLCEDGFRVPQDWDLAYKYGQVAAAQSNPGDMVLCMRLGRKIEARKRTESPRS